MTGLILPLSRGKNQNPLMSMKTIKNQGDGLPESSQYYVYISMKTVKNQNPLMS